MIKFGCSIFHVVFGCVKLKLDKKLFVDMLVNDEVGWLSADLLLVALFAVVTSLRVSRRCSTYRNADHATFGSRQRALRHPCSTTKHRVVRIERERK